MPPSSQGQVKTSLTHPIEVSFFPPAAVPLGGRLGMTFAPGRKGAGMTGMWDRDLELDLARIRRHYHADVLVSLMEDHEIAKYQMTALGDRASAFGLQLIRLPIPDVGIPSREADLVAVVRQILDHLANNRSVIIHCRGGIGRTGMVAGACLVALGHAPAAAIKLVRSTRSPNSIETMAQEGVVKHYRDKWTRPQGVGLHTASTFLHPYWPPVAPTERPTGPSGSFADTDPDEHYGISDWRPASRVPTLSAFRGCLLAGALGDALGYPIEFLKHQEIDAMVGHERPSKLGYTHGAGGEISDDTQMTLFTAEGLIRAVHRANRQGSRFSMGYVMVRAYLRWLHTQEHKPFDSFDQAGDPGWLIQDKRLYARRAPGNTCLSALRDPSPRANNDSKGCGAVMRVAPVGLASQSREMAFSLGNEVGWITHGHPAGYLSAGYFASLIFDLSRGMSLDGAMQFADGILKQHRGHEPVAVAINAARELAARGALSPKTIEQLGGGWVGEEALAIALACVLSADLRTSVGVADALWRSVCHSGDSDSTGAIAGNLIGASIGIEGLPTWWLIDLELADVIDRIAIDLHVTTVQGRELNLIDYPPH